jgi:hypothetical protein
MKTKAQFITECKAANPTMTQIVNGQEVVLSVEEYEKTVNAWADSQIAIQEFEADKAAKEASKSELLERLGITADEAALLLA